MLRLLLGICIGIMIVIVAGQLRERHAQTRNIPLSAVQSHDNRIAPISVGGMGHPPFAIEETGAPNQAELKRILHDSLQKKAADKDESGDW